MDASHILVVGLTVISIALSVWIEIRSRRNTAAQTEQDAVPAPTVEAQSQSEKRALGRR